MNNLLNSALQWAKLYPVIPIKPGDKIPLTPHGLKDASQLQSTVSDWWRRWPGGNIAIVCNGLLVLDFDVKEGGISEGKPALIAKYGDLPKTRVHKTGGSGGEHWLYSVPTDLNIRPGAKKYGYAGLDIRANDSYILVPPSVTTGKYEVIDDSPIAPAPDFLIELAKTKTPARISDKTDSKGIVVIPEGQRNDSLASLAGTLRHRGAAQEVIEVALLETNASQCQPPLDENEVRRIAASYGNYEPGQPGGNGHHLSTPNICFTLSDLGNAELFASNFSKLVKFVPELGIWRYWDDKVWRDDPQMVKMRWYASLVVRKLYGEAELCENQKDREATAKHALKSEGAERIGGMIKLLSSQPGMSIPLKEWDKDIYLLNLDNGILNLQTGELKSHDSGQFITRIINQPYDRASYCSLWFNFLDKITNGDAVLESYLQKAVGLSLTGDISRQVFFFLYGTGANGKSTFTHAIRQILGPYATRIATETIMYNNNGSHNEGLANIHGKRFIVASEPDAGNQLAVSLIKNITGGESLRASRKYEHEVEFIPEGKLWLFGNHKPIIKDTTFSIWRRVKLIPFTVTIPDSEKDEMLPAKLEAEYPGILDWAIRGWQDLQKEGIPDIEPIRQATATYRHDSDLLADFFDDTVEFDAEFRVEKSELKKAYAAWCEKNGQEALSRLNFKNRLLEKGITEQKSMSVRYWVGLRIVPQNVPRDNSENPDLNSKEGV